jgi:LysM repeat protein
MHSPLESTQPRTGPLARLAAVLALVAAVVVIAVIVAGSLGDSDEEGSKKGSGGGAAAESAGPSRDYYVLESGDTLSTVARKFGIGQAKIVELNPNLDPQALPPQGCVDLVQDGCKKLAAGG